MRLPIGRVIAFSLLFAGLSSAAPAPTPGALRYKFTVGEKLEYVSEHKMVITLDVLGTEKTITVTWTQDMVWHTLAREKDGAKISQTVERLRVGIEGPDPIGKGRYDSRDGKMPEGPVFEKIGPMLKSIVGKPVTMTVDPSGRSKDVKVPEAIQKEMKALDESNKANGTSFGSFNKLFGQGELILPNFSAAKGKVWERTEVSPATGGTLSIRHVYEHAGTEMRGGRKVEVISIKPTSKFQSDGSPATMKLKSQEASGKAWVDRAAGRLVETSITVKMELEVDLNGTTVTQKIEQTTSMKLKGK
jgi:hypothetical protein